MLETPAEVTATAVLWTWFALWAVVLSVVDIREHRLPNWMVASAWLGCVVFTMGLALAAGDVGVLFRAALASSATVVAFAVAHLVGGMGMGDVKYAAVTGWVLGTIGWSAVWWGHLLGFLVAGAVVIPGIVARRMHRRTAVPFGPFMGLGSIAAGLLAVAPNW